MSDVREVNAVHQDLTTAVKTDLQRRRELKRMSKPELIDYIVNVEDNLSALATRIDHAYGDEP